MFLGVEALREDVDVQLFELSLQHELVVADTNIAKGVEGVRLDIPRLVSHEEEDSLKHL